MSSHCDVAVVGGGPAGIAAALCAAETGARVEIIEAAPDFGGNVSQAFVHTICGLYLAGDKAIPSNPGFPLRFYAGLRDSGGAGVPERAGRVWVVPIRPLSFAAYAKECFASLREINCRLGSKLVGASLGRDSGAESVLIVQEADGGDNRRKEIVARAVVDASGDGALGSIGGVEHLLSAPDELQACSYIVQLRGVPESATEGFGRMKLTVAIARACEIGVLPKACESVLIRPAAKPGDAFVTLGLPPLPGETFDPLDEGYRARALEFARERAQEVVDHLRSERKGFSRCEIFRGPAQIGVREGRRLVGCTMLSRSEVLLGKRHADGVALSSWPIELWDNHQRARFQYPERACSVPLSALCSRSHPGLAMAGRCVSASHEALGALRVIGTALATGAAAGRAAALAADSRVSIRDVDTLRVRRAALGSDDESIPG